MARASSCGSRRSTSRRSARVEAASRGSTRPVACRSARAARAPIPGPACYGRGGVEPTVTDANVVLGFIPVGEVADGQITIRRELAEAAVERVATPLGLTVLEAADGIHRIANARMTRALRSVSSEKGRDPRDFAIIAYGGSGPVHAGGLADELGVHDDSRPGGGRPVQRGRLAVRAARVPRGPLVPPRRRRRRARRRSPRSSRRWRRC